MPVLKFKDGTGKWVSVGSPSNPVKSVNGKTGDVTLTADDISAVSSVNGKTGKNISLTANDIGAAPAYTYGTEDLIAGESSLATGKLHFVYE